MKKFTTQYCSFPLDGDKCTQKKEQIDPSDQTRLDEILRSSLCGILLVGGQEGTKIDYVEQI